MLNSEHGHEEALSLSGYLNSSTYAFWGRLNFYQHGDKMGEGARLSKTPWQDRLQMAGNQLQQLPIPSLKKLRATLIELVVVTEDTVRLLAEVAPEKVVAATLALTPTLDGLREARSRSLAERARLRGILVSLQEEMDWRVYGIFGLPTVTAPSVEAVRVPVEPNHRPFEVRLAREVSTDISASEWFRVHKREAPADVGGPLAELYRQRLRLTDDPEHGRELRLLETPENKRRWPLPDDHAAFDTAARDWLLERIEQVFREQAQPELLSVRQIGLEVTSDPRVQAVHELLTETTGHDLVRLLSDLVDREGVPFLAGWRYSESGVEKRTTWEDTWELQRLEDAGALQPELKRRGLDAIPVPEKYAPKDLLRHFWSLRGKLDVPKERFVTVPGGQTDEDATPIAGWAGWDHLQISQALAALYQRRRTESGWGNERLVPLVAGLAEHLPWLLQWHNEPSTAHGGQRLGQFFKEFIGGECHRLGISTDDLRGWTPPAAPKRGKLTGEEVMAALLAWKPEVDEEDEDITEEESPEGPTVADLASALGTKKESVRTRLKKLVQEGRVEMLGDKKTKYFVAIGEEE
jgi:hypothetical protein